MKLTWLLTFATMKFFAFIMAVMILVFSCMPCMDEPFTVDNSKMATSIAGSHDHRQHSDADACSPFCTCNCCAGFGFVIAPYQIESIIKPVVERNAIQLPSSVSEISLPVWQPPQLS